MPDTNRPPQRRADREDGYVVAVIGATGNVGREMLQILADRKFPVSKVLALASERSIGAEVSFGEDEVLPVHDLAKFDFRGVDIALSSPGAKISAVRGVNHPFRRRRADKVAVARHVHLARLRKI